MIIFCWLVSGHRGSTLIPHSSFCMESITFPHSFGCRWDGSLTSAGADLQLPAVPSDGLTSPEPPPPAPQPTGVYDPQAQTVQTGGPPSVEAGIQLKAIRPFSGFIFILTTALLSHKIFCLFFFCQKLPLCAWKGADAEAAGRSDPRALRGWLKNKLISGSIDGGQAGKYHGKLNYRDSWERRHWPALINSM